MALYPKAVPRLIDPGSNDPAIQVVGAILHVDAGNALSLHDHFKYRSGGIESHFHITKSGRVEQYRDTGYEADANLNANSFWDGGVRKGYISIETQGLGEGEWTPDQLVAIKALLQWIHETHDVPLTVCQTPTDPGVGFHTLFGAPSAWTPVAKTCPGPGRIRQFNDELVPWMASFLDSPAPLPGIRKQLRRRLRAAKTETRKAWLRRVLRIIRNGPEE